MELVPFGTGQSERGLTFYEMETTGVYVRRVFPSRLLAGLPESVCRLRLARHPNLTPLLRSAESR